MTDELVYKTIPLAVAKSAARISETPEERAARVQAHIDRVRPMLDAIKLEEARVQHAFGDPVERALANNRKWKRKMRAAARTAMRRA